MKLAFIWSWDRAYEILPNWRDGLRASLETLEKDHKVAVKWFLAGEMPREEDKYDFILFWDDSNSPTFQQLDKYSARKGIILTTDPHNIENLKKLDVVFCESQPIYEAVRSHGIRAIKAFGTDTNFYKPQGSPKESMFFYPATFSPWKRQDTLLHLGKHLICVGTVQPDGREIFQKCKDAGVQIIEGYIKPEMIRDLYDKCKYVPIPAIHGSERTCLEAMSMNILPVVNPDNKRTISYVEEYVRSGYFEPRDFILANYSERVYANNLMKGIIG